MTTLAVHVDGQWIYITRDAINTFGSKNPWLNRKSLKTSFTTSICEVILRNSRNRLVLELGDQLELVITRHIKGNAHFFDFHVSKFDRQDVSGIIGKLKNFTAYLILDHF